jgi:ABC-type transport system substrate-binding protein
MLRTLRAPAATAVAVAALGLAASIGTTASAASRGGDMVITWSQNNQTIDPNKIYNAEDWNIGHALYVGLYDFGTDAQLVPALAAGMPTVSDHGLVYTVHLKSGLKWSNGAPITAEDFAASVNRELNPKTQSPDGYLWYMLKGAQAVEAGHAQSVSGVRVLNATTIQYTLTQPYPPFPYILAVPAGFPIYPPAVSQIATHPVTDGPFRLASWTPGQTMVLVRNPYYYRAGLPYLDRLTFDFGVDPSVGVLRVEAGQADLVGDGIPSANYVQLTTSPQWSRDVATRPAIGVYMLALNTRVAPFNNLKVRQAVEMAIDKRHLLQLLNGRGVAANGVLPTTLPGFDGKDIPNLYPYNPNKARALLREAGYPHGFTTTLGLGSELSGGDVIGTEVQADLRAIGIHVAVKPLPSEATAIASMPMTTYTWFMDYPDPADFIDGFTSCGAAVVGGSNPAFLCDRGLDAAANAARPLPLGPARVAAYRRIDLQVMRDAAYVPLYFPLFTFFHSSRLGGYYVNLAWFPADYSTLYLKP